MIAFNGALISITSLEVDELNLENQGRVGRDQTIADVLVAVSVGRGAGEGGLSALVELLEALVPALDDLADSAGDLEGLASVD